MYGLWVQGESVADQNNITLIFEGSFYHIATKFFAAPIKLFYTVINPAGIRNFSCSITNWFLLWVSSRMMLVVFSM